MSWIDAHIHLDKYEQAQLELIVAEAKREQIERLVAVSVDLASSQLTKSLYEQHPHLVFPCYGYHPEQPLPNPEDEKRLFQWIEQRAIHNEPFAIGEVGLPYYQEQEAKLKGQPFDLTPYKDYLMRWFKFAQKWDKPIGLHVIYEHVDIVLDMLEEVPLKDVHFHWYKGSKEATKEIIRRGYMISITPDITYEAYTQSLICEVPLELMMLETDGPWQYEHVLSNRLTTPAMIKRSCRVMSTLLRLDDQVVKQQLYENSKRFYKID